MNTPLEFAKWIVMQPSFDGLHDPDKKTALIEPYHDPVGYPTIGYGHLLSRVAWEPLAKYPAVTTEEAERLLEVDLMKSFRAVRRLCPVEMTAYQAGALIDFTFNCGGGNLEISMLRRCVNRGDMDSAAEQFGRWIYAKGVKLPGLVKRRAVESQMFRGMIQ
jgi:lysozyme